MLGSFCSVLVGLEMWGCCVNVLRWGREVVGFGVCVWGGGEGKGLPEINLVLLII